MGYTERMDRAAQLVAVVCVEDGLITSEQMGHVYKAVLEGARDLFEGGKTEYDAVWIAAGIATKAHGATAVHARRTGLIPRAFARLGEEHDLRPAFASEI